MGLRYIVDQSFQLLVCGHKVKSYLVTVRNVAMLNIASNIVDVSYDKTYSVSHLAYFIHHITQILGEVLRL